MWLAALTFLAYIGQYTFVFWFPTMLKRLTGFTDMRVGVAASSCPEYLGICAGASGDPFRKKRLMYDLRPHRGHTTRPPKPNLSVLKNVFPAGSWNILPHMGQ